MTVFSDIMSCSAVTLSLATITAVVAVALLGIAFGTDNWLYIAVDRNAIQVSGKLQLSDMICEM